MASQDAVALPRRGRMLRPALERRGLGPGLVLSAGLSILALALGAIEERFLGHALLEALVLALLLGVIVRNAMPRPHAFVLGTGYAAKQVLELGVGLLGATIDLRQVAAAGPALIVLAVTGVFGGILVSFAAGRAIGLHRQLALLVAVGNSICGNSAIAAVAPVIRAEKRDVASAIALTAVLGVCLVIGLPLLIPLLGLNHYQYGVLAGMGVYAVPQVVAVAFPVSQLSGQVATLVKLTRVMLLGPVVVTLALVERSRGGGGEARKAWSAYVPWFVTTFFVLAVARSTGILSASIASPVREVSRVLTIVAMAGMGFGVELAAVKKVGPRVGSAVIVSLAFMISLTVVLIHVLGIRG
jgi:uncharacterized integral membrane protein (TIGR00698 family)